MSNTESVFVPYDIAHPIEEILKISSTVNENDDKDIRFTYSNEGDQEKKELTTEQTLAIIIQSIKKLNTNFEKIKKGYFIGTELLKNNGL